MMPQNISFATGIKSMARSSHVDCAPWVLATSLPHQLHLGRMIAGTGKLSKSRVAAARSLSLRPRQTQPERLHTRDGRFETRENYSRLFSAQNVVCGSKAPF